MKNIQVKIVSVLLSASVLFSIASCSGSNSLAETGTGENRSGKKITADTPWFYNKQIEVEPDLGSGKQVDYTYNQLAGADDKYIVVLTSGYYSMPTGNDIDWDNYNYNAYAIALVSVIDRQTNQTVKCIDLADNLDSNDYLDSASYYDGTITAKYFGYNPNTYISTQKEMDIDVESGNVIATREEEESNGNYERSFKFGDYRIDTQMNWEEVSSYTICIYAPDGSVNKVKVGESGKNFYDIPVILPIDNNNVLIPVNTDDGFVFYTMEIATGKLTPSDGKDYEWIEFDRIYMPYIGSDNTVYYSSSTGINKIDFKNKATEQVFNYNWCNANRNQLEYLEIADLTDDSIVLCGEIYDSNAYSNIYSSHFVIVELNRAENNPHAGKTILELYSDYGYVEEEVSEAILKYNSTSKSYFIEVTDRYNSSYDDYDYSNINSEDDYTAANLNISSKISNKLAIDIINGDGPDIIMNAGAYGQLNNKNYLADLTPYISNLSPDKYFTNIIEASGTDGALYQLPICYSISGIQTDKKYAGASGIGFTTAEYEDFMKNVLNGDDVITAGQAYYFTSLFNAMSDKFLVNGKADFSGPEFAELAEYVKENVREYARDWDDIYSEESVAVEPAYAVGVTVVKGDAMYGGETAVYSSCYGISSYFYSIVQTGGGTAILGIPSTDGRGPLIEPNITVAVSAQAYDVNACGEFVKILLSDEIQESLAMNDRFVLNREAFREGGMAAVTFTNCEDGKGMYVYDDSTGNPIENRAKMTEANVDDMENIILSCSRMKSADAAINIILAEEMPAYFSGQKDLASVIQIAQDRAQKVLSERG